jgi:L,D-peptidoglycan transpeptidase YkuD (ErfK/YbiS/YcfS/YnhG family)
VPGGGSAIFFHVRRGPDKPSAGCTTMAVEPLEWMIRWLRPEDSPHYVLLPRADYMALRLKWRLP